MPNLTREQIDACPHSSMVTRRAYVFVARVWLLANDATPDAIPTVLMIEAIKLEPEVEVRTGLLQALDLFTATQNTAGHV